MQEADSILRRIANRRIIICAFTGFTSGLPFYFLIQLVPGWLRSEGVDLKQIGLLALVQLPYVWKFAWSPLLDRYQLPLLGRRRGWMLAAQVCLLASIALVGRGESRDRPSIDSLARGDRCVLQCDAGHRARCVSAGIAPGTRTRPRKRRSHSDVPNSPD